MRILAAALTALLMASAPLVVSAQTSADPASQRQAILACKRELGIGGLAQMRTTWQSRTLFGGTSVVRIEPYDQVTPEAAARINECAARATGVAAAEPVAVSAPVVPAPTYDPDAAFQAEVDFWRTLTCPPGYSGFFRGTLYCGNGRLMR
ncbi:hypothetical protein AB2B41_15595 [Marimonas sp. MJW-29]|uniref:HdeA/HdeB family protein n=1 Tax=Sulfitobacter sediminis TaxID=3234186 RepID=A0ABV3RPZ4_9RHOB